MKTCVVTCFLLFANIIVSQSDRRLIKEIDSINTYAIRHYTKNHILESFEAFNKVKKMSDSINDNYGKSISNLYLGNIYKLMYEYEDAIRCYKAMLKPSIEINDNYLLAISYLNQGKLAKKNKDSKKSILYLKKASQYASNYSKNQKSNLQQQITIELTDCYIENGFLDKALISLTHLEDYIVNAPKLNYFYKANSGYLKAKLLCQKGQYYTAIIKLELALQDLYRSKYTKQGKSNLLFSKIYKQTATVYAQLKNTEAAYSNLLKHNNYNKAYFNQEKRRLETVEKSKFLIEDYKNEIEIANSEKLYQSKIAKKTKNINFVMVIALLLLGVSLVAIYFNYVSKRKLANVLEKRNDKLELAKNDALKSSELKSKFISNVTHELRTPLYGVVGLTSLLLANNNLSEKDGKYLKSLKYSGDYLLRLINEILEFGKIESNKIELKKVSVDLRQLLENIIGSFDYKLKETNNKIHLRIDRELPQYVKCDNVRLSQVLINLIGNGVKFTTNGDIFVTVLVKHVIGNKVDLRFEVKDTGGGIPKEKFKTIFEDFSQLENSNTSYKGTGLGLTITKKIIELFDSKIELESEYGSGSTFSFNVNFEIDKKGLQHAKAKTIKKKIRSINCHRILIAEDNKINQIVTRNLLEKANYYCEIAENGEEAINILKSKTFDLVLMDINMPKMGGIEATNLIRDFNMHIPVLALTAADIEDFNENIKYSGFNGLITKPFDNYEFFQLIETNIQVSKKGLVYQQTS
jgi:signal transduction histidine kinase/CheY-like chemotaxis protein